MWLSIALLQELKTLVDYAFYGSKGELIASLSTAMAKREVDQVVTDAPYSDKVRAYCKQLRVKSNLVWAVLWRRDGCARCCYIWGLGSEAGGSGCALNTHAAPCALNASPRSHTQEAATLREWLDSAEAAAAVDESEQQEEEQAPVADREMYIKMSLSDVRKLRVRKGRRWTCKISDTLCRLGAWSLLLERCTSISGRHSRRQSAGTADIPLNLS